ncbi:hypothetical protein M885DRAFT_573128 [Pelagophyceae sp. CCMP2097]|nr:hypothetical protein M885DRAFT_573128 [Pelagophyceae sp. CCMP2097]
MKTLARTAAAATQSLIGKAHCGHDGAQMIALQNVSISDSITLDETMGIAAAPKRSSPTKRGAVLVELTRARGYGTHRLLKDTLGECSHGRILAPALLD